MLGTLRRISLRHGLQHKLRTLFTIFGIALGVAAIVGMRLMHDSVSRGYERTVERIAGKAGLQISNGEPGVPEELLEEVRSLPGIAAAAATVQGFVSLPGRRGERLYIFGIDLLADSSLRDVQFESATAEVEDPLIFLAQPDSIAVTRAFLDRTGLAVGNTLEVLAPRGKEILTIRGVLDVNHGPASLFAGRFAVMDLFAAQRLFHLDRRFSQIDLGFAERADVNEVEARLRARVGGRGIVEAPRARGRALEQLLAANRHAMTAGAMVAVVVGLYLIFNTMMIAVAQRRREIGILRSVGMRRAEVLRLIVAEALVYGTAGSALGVPLGVAMARGMSAAFARTVSTMYVPVEVPSVTLALEPALWGIVLGIASALAASLAPAREAVRVHPLEVLRPVPVVSPGTQTYARVALAGLGVLILSALGWLLRAWLPFGSDATGGLSMVGLLVGSSLLVPLVVRGMVSSIESLLGRALGPLGTLASRNLVSQIGRVAITCTAFLVSLAGAIALATWLSSFQRTLTIWLDSLFSNIDLVITAGAEPLGQDSTPLPGSLADEIAALPAVERVDVVRMARVAYRDSLTLVIATDATLYAKGSRDLTLLQGDRAGAIRALERGEGLVVNEAFMRRFGIETGDSLTLPTPNGEMHLPVVGVYFDPTFADLGTIHLDREVYRHTWRDDTVNFIEPVLRGGSDREQVMEEIRSRWGERHDLFVFTIEQFREEADGILKQAMALAYPMIGMAIAIALLGVVNSLIASVLDRIREIGMLRAVGATRGQIARIVMIESSLIGLVGGLLAVAVGSVLGYAQLEILFRGMLGMTVFYRYPATAVAFALVAAVALAAAAGYLPGRRAGRVNITEALEYE